MKKAMLLLSAGVWGMVSAEELPKIKPIYFQEQVDGTGFGQGRVYLSGGVGAINLNSILANKIKNSISDKWKTINYSGSTIWFVKGEYAVSQHSGVGLTFSRGGFDISASLPDSFTKLNIPVSGNLAYKTWSLQGRINVHLFAENNLDVYAGLGLGFRSNSFEVTDNDPEKDWWNFPIDLSFVEKIIPSKISVPTVGGDFTIGARYFVAPPLAIYAEIGIAKSIGQAGITFRF